MANTNTVLVSIGSIYACIAGDHRYASQVSVKVDETAKKVFVILEENGAVGGMDGPGGSTPMRETAKRECGYKPAEIIKAIKSVMDDTIKRYGKPTKNFRWYPSGKGLSAKACKDALEALTALE